MAPTGVRVRRGTVHDLPLLVLHRRRMWEDMGYGEGLDMDGADATYRKWLRTRLRSGRVVAFVVEVKGQPAATGCVWVRDVQPRPGLPRTLGPYLMSMYTEPDHRGQGLATLVVEASIRWCRQQGFPRLDLHASKFGRGVYQRLGFERTWEMRLGLGGGTGSRPTGRRAGSRRAVRRKQPRPA